MWGQITAGQPTDLVLVVGRRTAVVDLLVFDQYFVLELVRRRQTRIVTEVRVEHELGDELVTQNVLQHTFAHVRECAVMMPAFTCRYVT